MTTLDPITLEVVRNTLPAISNEMSLDLQRASYNMMIYEVRDYCCALLNAEGDLLAQNLGGVSHFVADLGVVIRDAIERYGRDGFAPGDVIISNHQRVSGQHLNNMAVYTPIFFRDRLRGFAIIRAHWVDVGGMSTGFGSGGAYDPWLEGLQLDQLKLYEGGLVNESLLRVIRDNVRMPERSMGDLRAQIASCELAGRRMNELDERYGPDVIDQAVQRIFDYSEECCRQVVAEIPDGVYEAESFLSGGRLSAGGPVEIKARVTVKGSDMEIDLSGCSPQRRETINSRTQAGALIAYKALTGPTDPLNEGSFRAVRVIIPEGNIMMARFPAPMANWSMILPTVAETVLVALAPAMPDRIPAGNAGTLGHGLTFFGVGPDGKRFMSSSIEGGGWGGRPFEDGPSGVVSICQGDVRNGPIEALELEIPFVVEERGYVQDSGGPGKYRGGLTVRFRVRTLTEGRFNIGQSMRRDFPPRGLWGGRAGKTFNTLIKLPDDEDFRKDVTVSQFLTPPGTVAVASGAGGGGWGDPHEREPAAVLDDVIEGYVSPGAALEEYAVVVDVEHQRVDELATSQRRAELREKRAVPV